MFCIGRFISEAPLIELVAKMAKSSATSAPRFFADPATEVYLFTAEVFGADFKDI
jgi:AMMECR1 domain-containing protein